MYLPPAPSGFATLLIGESGKLKQQTIIDLAMLGVHLYYVICRSEWYSDLERITNPFHIY